MPRRFKQLLTTKHPEYIPPTVSTGNKTDSLMEGILGGAVNAMGSMQRGIKNAGEKMKDLNSAADDGLMGIATHGAKDNDETEIKKRWEGLGQVRQQSWEEHAKTIQQVRTGTGVRYMTGWEAFRENELKTRKDYAIPRKPVGYQQFQSDSPEFTAQAQQEWNVMDPQDHMRYNDDFNEYLEMKKRIQNQQGGATP
jgi:hypothetical protein